MLAARSRKLRAASMYRSGRGGSPNYGGTDELPNAHLCRRGLLSCSFPWSDLHVPTAHAVHHAARPLFPIRSLLPGSRTPLRSALPPSRRRTSSRRTFLRRSLLRCTAFPSRFLVNSCNYYRPRPESLMFGPGFQISGTDICFPTETTLRARATRPIPPDSW